MDFVVDDKKYYFRSKNYLSLVSITPVASAPAADDGRGISCVVVTAATSTDDNMDEHENSS